MVLGQFWNDLKDTRTVPEPLCLQWAKNRYELDKEQTDLNYA